MTRPTRALPTVGLALALALGWSGCGFPGFGPGGAGLRRGPSERAIATAITEALHVATQRTIERTGRDGGFRDDARIRLRLPPELDGMTARLKTVGLGGQMNVLELAMNRAAERAAGDAQQLFDDAIAGLTIQHPSSVLNGPDDAATQILRRQAGAKLARGLTARVDDAMRQVGLIQAYGQLLARYASLDGFEAPRLELVEYVRDGTLRGLFIVLAEQERRIRSDPAARNGELLKTVFGSRTPRTD
jgi:hypothetical protein